MSRTFRQRPPLGCWLSLLLISAVAIRFATSQSVSPSPLRAGEYTVLSVRDERTLLIGNESTPSRPVKLLGVALPPQVSESELTAAKLWLEKNLLGQTVRVELDHRRTDREGTALAYVYHRDKFVNSELLPHSNFVPENYPGDSASHARLLRNAVAER